MKRVISCLLALVLVLALAGSAMAETIIMYVVEDNVKAYAEQNTASTVRKSLTYGEKLLIEQKGEYWCSILVEAPGGDGQTLAWVETKSLSVNPPPCRHSWNDWTVSRAATCSSTGLRTRSCKLCGEVEVQDIAKLPHEYGDWKVRRDSSCTQEGEMYTNCKVCGAEKTAKIEKKPHTWGNWTVTKEATCTAKGERAHWCTVCGTKQTQEIDKKPHDYGPWTVTKEPTCTAKGEQARWCRVCGREKTEEIAKLPHSYGEWVIVLEATENSAGVRSKTCEVCGKVKEESFDPEGTLRRGDKGDAVSEIQQLLVKQGYLDKKKADGSYGGGTEKAIMKFQKDQGLTIDGVAWPETIARLHHNFGEWEILSPFTRYSNLERVRTCFDCGYQEFETLKAGVSFARKDTGSGIRALQQMLNEMGFKAGEEDGSYGRKLDNALMAFAKDNALEFIPDTVRPGDLDAVVNAWLAFRPEEKWSGEGDKDSPVNLILTVTPSAKQTDETGAMRSYDWTLTNLGSEKCRFMTLLLNCGENPDFRGDNMVVEIDRSRLKADGENKLSGSFRVAADWCGDAEALNFCALGLADATGELWMSNIVVRSPEA